MQENVYVTEVDAPHVSKVNASLQTPNEYILSWLNKASESNHSCLLFESVDLTEISVLLGSSGVTHIASIYVTRY
jgi:hypothetical protein